MHSQSPHKPQLPARIPQQPEEPPRTMLGALMHRPWVQGPWMRGPWKRVWIIGGSVVGVLAVLLVAVNLIISADWLQARVAARIKEQTGRDLTVNGSTMLLFTPGPHVVITDARITDPNAKPGTADLSVAKLTLDLNFSDLFSRRVDAERVVLVRPVFTVRLGDETQPMRWGGADEKPKKVRFAKAEMSGAPKRHRDVHLKDVRVEDGTVVIKYDGDDANTERRVEHINAKLSLPAVTDPLVGHGKLDWKNQTVDFSFEVKTPADLQAKRPARLQLALDTYAISARFDGTVVTAPHLSGQGKLSAKSSSIPSVLAWMREDQDISSAIGDGELASDVSWTQGKITLSHARFALEHASGHGQAVVTLKRPRPHVRAAIALEHLDLNPFLAKAKTKQRAAAPDTRPASPSSAASPSDASRDWFDAPVAPEVEKKITPPPQKAEATPAPKPQATAPDTARVSAPAAIDADVNLNVRQTRVGHLDIGPSSLGLAFRNGVMHATLGGMELYDGHARGTLTIDASKPVPTFTGDFRLDGVQAKPLLSDAAQFDMIAGRTKLTLDISGEGEDADAIKSSLRGQGSVVVSDGSIQGIDITAFISALGQGDFNLRQGPDAKTAFSDLGGSFTISDGIAETHNLKMVSPLLKVMADGTVDLARSNLDIMAHPEIVKGPEGKGGANDALAGLTVPVRIEGPLDAPQIRPQIGSVFANPDTASKTVNKIGEALQKKFKGRPVGEAIGRFLGNVHIGRGNKPAPKQRRTQPQALSGPQAAEPKESDADDAMDPDLKEILR
jgi:AsmA protein